MPKRSTAQSAIIPPPVNGWNTKDPISNMDQTYALEALNYFSDGNTVDTRDGYTSFASGLGQAVTGLFEFSAGSTDKLLAIATNPSFRTYDISAGGGSPVDLSSGGTLPIDGITARAVNFRNLIFIKDSFLYPVRTWDGAAASLSNPGFVGPSSADTLLRCPSVYKSRIYFLGSQTSIWFGGVDAITGNLTEFNCGSVLADGGQLMFGGPLQEPRNSTVQQSNFAIVTNKGEVLIYQGDSPVSTTWSLVGRYKIPPPASIHSFIYWGRDLLVITYSGIISLGGYLDGAQEGLAPISDNINNTFIAALGALTTNAPYVRAVHNIKAGYLIFSIPNNAVTEFSLYVYSTKNKSWWLWQFSEGVIDPLSWAFHNNDLYFGANSSKVYKMGGDRDEGSTEAVFIPRTLKLRTAFNYFGQPSMVKQFTESRPILKESEGLNLTMDVDVDYADNAPTSNYQDLSDTSYKLYRPRMGLRGIGKAASIRLEQSITTKRRSIQAIEVLWNEGDIT
jgi:hypothetical protein